MRDFNKVFGIGFLRTGTRSLAEALTILGAQCTDYVDVTTYNQVRRGDYGLEVLKRDRGMANWASAVYWRELSRRYPGSLFVCTDRNLDDWLESMRLVMAEKEDLERYPEKARQLELWRFYCAAAFGVHSFHKERLAREFLAHKEAVAAFSNRARMQVYFTNICAGEGWEPLCRFLDTTVPTRSFPHLHDLPNRIWPERGKKVTR